MKALLLVLSLCTIVSAQGQSARTLALLQKFTLYSPLGRPFNQWWDGLMLDEALNIDSVQIADSTAYLILKASLRNPRQSPFPEADSVMFYLVRGRFGYRKTVNGFETDTVTLRTLTFSTQYYFSKKQFLLSAWQAFQKQQRSQIRRQLNEVRVGKTTKELCCYETFSYHERTDMFPLVRTLYRYDEEQKRYIFSFDINFVLNR